MGMEVSGSPKCRIQVQAFSGLPSLLLIVQLPMGCRTSRLCSQGPYSLQPRHGPGGQTGLLPWWISNCLEVQMAGVVSSVLF